MDGGNRPCPHERILHVPLMASLPHTVALMLATPAWLLASAPTQLPAALRGVDPAMLSGGSLLALETAGAFGAPKRPAAATYADAGKGQSLALLDARVGPNVTLGEDPEALPANQRGQAEPHVARSSRNGDLLLATFQEGRFAADGGSLGCGYGVSRDGGLTWSRALIPRLTTSSGGPFPRATDPVAAIGPQGDFYLNTLGSVDDAFGLSSVVLSRSTDEGTTWTDPITIHRAPSALEFPDKNWLAVNDRSESRTAGRLVVTWTNFTSNATGASTGNNIVAAVSDDRGTTWTAPIPVTPAGTSNQGSLPLFLPDGSLLVPYITFLSGTTRFSIQCKRSADGGLTYPAAATTIVATVNGWDDPLVRDGVFLPGAAVARDSGDAFVTYTALVGNAPRVMVTRSKDGGLSWSAPTVVSPGTGNPSVMNPAVAASPDGREVAVVYMQRPQTGDSSSLVDHYAVLSHDGGVTWPDVMRLTNRSGDLRSGPQTNRGVMYGDYLGLAAPVSGADAFVAVWCDSRSGDSDPQAARLAASATPGFAAWATAQRTTNDPGADPDGDGVPNYFEFLDALDPRRSDAGTNIAVRRPAAGALDVLWTERDGALRTTGWKDGFVVGRFNGAASEGLASGSLVEAALTDADLPPPPGNGLRWRGARLPWEGEARALARAARADASGTQMVSGVLAVAQTDSRLINLSARGQIPTDQGDLAAGFVVDGAKRILVRAAGPALTALAVPGALPDPRITLTSPSPGFVPVTNDTWSQGNADAALFARLGAFPFAAGSADAALQQTLAGQAYSATVSGGRGIVLAEVYDADGLPGDPARARLLNVSTRALVGNGANALFAGFVVRGTQPRRILVRAVGPGLAAFGVGGTLADPQFSVYRQETVVASNDDWETAPGAAALAVLSARLGAFPLAGASRDAALALTLPPGSYTVVVTGVAGASGLALVEVYDAD